MVMVLLLLLLRRCTLLELLLRWELKLILMLELELPVILLRLMHLVRRLLVLRRLAMLLWHGPLRGVHHGRGRCRVTEGAPQSAQPCLDPVVTLGLPMLGGGKFWNCGGGGP
jgi:hypothetical protein